MLVGQLDPFPGGDRYADVWGEGNYAYIGSYVGSGVGIIDISTPSVPFLAGTYSPTTGGQFKDVKVHNGIGYFSSDDGGGLHIVDLSNPASPTLLRQITSAQNGYDDIHNSFVSGGHLYQADSHTPTVKVFNVSDPVNPFFVRDIVTTDPSFVHDITVVGNRLYTSGFGGKTDIYDVSNIASSAPALLGAVTSGSNSHSSWATTDGNTLVSAREISDGDVRIFDISNPANPILGPVITRDTLGIDAFTPHNPVIVGNLLFTSWYEAGLQIHDISDPLNPVHIGAYDTYSGTEFGYKGNWGVYPFLGTNKILLSDLDGGLFIVSMLPVPEPETYAMMLVGLGLIGWRLRRKSRRSRKRRLC